jgi:hypothetical protein
LGPEKFLVASGWGSKGKTLPAGCEQLGRHTKLKLCRKLHTDNIGLRNFIQLNWSSGLFPGKSLKNKKCVINFLLILKISYKNNFIIAYYQLIYMVFHYVSGINRKSTVYQ